MEPTGRIAAWCLENAPSGRALLFGGPPALAGAWGALALAARFRRRGVRVGFTRKVFHVLVFATVTALQALLGTPAVCLFGAAVSLVVLHAVLRGPGHPCYEAIARPADAPHRTLFVVVPYLTTLLGGVTASVLFGPVALVGFLVAGLGDAAGEPVGARFGRHRYRVRSLLAVPATRSLEGSVGVFLASVLALSLAVAIAPDLRGGAAAIPAVVAIAVAATVAEAASPHGLDNLTMQILPAALASLLLA